MQQLINLIESTDLPIELKIGSLSVCKNFTFGKDESKRSATITTRIYCQRIHIQALLDLGVYIKFETKNNDFGPKQKHIGKGLNDLSFEALMSHKVFAKVNIFFRKDYQADICNNQNLAALGFPFNQRTLNKYNLAKYVTKII